MRAVLYGKDGRFLRYLNVETPRPMPPYTLVSNYVVTPDGAWFRLFDIVAGQGLYRAAD